VATWRGLKKLGAVNIQQSMWILPYSEENITSLTKISQDIEANQGESLLIESQFMIKKQEDRVVSLFNQVRDVEYGEFVRECEKYLKEIEKEIAQEKFIFAELEEEEEEFEKLTAWYRKIEIRDKFNAFQGEKAREILVQIRDAYERYSKMVYSHEMKGRV
jgi:hypothetical protein